ncbi:site-specific integrase [Labrenzia sp. VG12]|uniref:site-specific integrase n=1 Tax=Labrenzia sp. VG12 TaxID=2021862 RepID=UPI000B8C0826|nr:site-specific integrase [Labrenzia sp. VG12]ASP32244.1 integrase [Labrenzia sp. VG12]
MASIRKRSGKYHVQVRRQGFPTQTKSFSHLKDAKEWARQKELEADRGELESSKADLKKYTLGDIVTRYLDEVVPLKKQSVETTTLKAFLRHPICSKRLDLLTTADFAAYRDERLQSIAPISLKRQLAPISHAFEISKTEWDIPIRDNPVEKLTLKARDNRRERRLKEGEQEKLIEAARTRQNPLIEKVIKFAIETGMRRGEILGLRWDQVDLKRRSVTILEAKNGYSRTTPLTPGAFALLQAMRSEAEDENLMSKRVFPLSPVALRMAWQRMLAKTDIEDLHFHDLRHEAISRFFEMGLTVPEVASISGHRDMKMLMRYAHADTTRLAKKLEAAE